MRQLLIIVFVLGLIAAGAIVAGLMMLDDGPSFTGPHVLSWRLDQGLLDYAPVPDLPWRDESGEASLATIYKALVSARHDPDVEGLALTIYNARFGFAKAQQIRRLLHGLRDEGKFVDCYLETAGEGTNGTTAYFVATACDTIRLAPGRDLNLLGLNWDMAFLRGTFDKLKIEPDFVHIGKYKSGAEGFTHYESSPEAEEAFNALLDDYYAQLVAAIAEARGFSEKRVAELIDGAPYTSLEALELDLVDTLSYPDQFQDALEESMSSTPEYIRLEAYDADRSWGRGRRIAIIFAQGSIRRGHGGVDPWTGSITIGSRDLTRTLREVAENDSIAAVVLRIDSPGGSALASDLILREVDLLAQSKPLIVSMSDLAASGGYYIATKGARIVAEEATLTGSIGVYGGKLVTRRFEQELLGISHDTLKRGENADIYSSLEPFTPRQVERIEAMMTRVYDDFRQHVASGRGMTIEQVEEVAQGRVWTGVRALENGLVDELGGLERALELAREELGLESDADIRLAFYPRPPGLFDYLLGRAQPFLPIRFELPFSDLLEDNFRLLELPPELARLANPSF
jgi:protease-4